MLGGSLTRASATTSFAAYKRIHDEWYAGAAALRAHAPLLWLKSEDFFRAPEEEVQRVFDFLGLERADVSLKAFEEDHVKKYVARPGRSPPPPPPPPPPRRARTADERLAANHRAFDSYFGF